MDTKSEKIACFVQFIENPRGEILQNSRLKASAYKEGREDLCIVMKIGKK